MASLASVFASRSIVLSITAVDSTPSEAVDASPVAWVDEIVSLSSVGGSDGVEVIVDEESRVGFSTMDSSSDDECINKVASLFVYGMEKRTRRQFTDRRTFRVDCVCCVLPDSAVH